MNLFRRNIRKLALAILVMTAFLAGCNRASLKPDPCALIGTKDYADVFYEDVVELRVQKGIPENNDNYFWLYEIELEEEGQENLGGGQPSLSLNPEGAKGIAFRARVVDDGNAPNQIPSDLFLTFVIGYEFPKNDCQVTLDWAAHPYLYLPHGAEVSEDNDLVPSGSPVSHLQFQVYVIEDPDGDIRMDAIPDSLTESELVDSIRYTETFSSPTSAFKDTYEGSFVVRPGVNSRLYVVLAVWLKASWAGERVCVGCNLPINEPNNLLESAQFSVGSGSAGSNGPFWIMESLSQ